VLGFLRLPDLRLCAAVHFFSADLHGMCLPFCGCACLCAWPACLWLWPVCACLWLLSQAMHRSADPDNSEKYYQID